jgi:hypothetical protein
MRKIIQTAAFAAAFALPMAPAVAADISNLSGQSCASETGTWHFVNNQTGGAPAGTLTATFENEDGTTNMVVVGASKVLANTQHFNVTSSGTLVAATTGSLPGRLVLSDFSCEDSKKK